VAGALEGGDSLESLDISGNAVGSFGILALAKALKDNQNLRTLEVSYNPIEATGAKALIDMLKFDLKVPLPPPPPNRHAGAPLLNCKQGPSVEAFTVASATLVEHLTCGSLGGLGHEESFPCPGSKVGSNGNAAQTPTAHLTAFPVSSEPCCFTDGDIKLLQTQPTPTHRKQQSRYQQEVQDHMQGNHLVLAKSCCNKSHYHDKF